VDITQYPDLVFLLDDDVQLTIPASRYFYTVSAPSSPAPAARAVPRGC